MAFRLWQTFYYVSVSWWNGQREKPSSKKPSQTRLIQPVDDLPSFFIVLSLRFECSPALHAKSSAESSSSFSGESTSLSSSPDLCVAFVLFATLFVLPVTKNLSNTSNDALPKRRLAGVYLLFSSFLGKQNVFSHWPISNRKKNCNRYFISRKSNLFRPTVCFLRVRRRFFRLWAFELEAKWETDFLVIRINCAKYSDRSIVRSTV